MKEKDRKQSDKILKRNKQDKSKEVTQNKQKSCVEGSYCMQRIDVFKMILLARVIPIGKSQYYRKKAYAPLKFSVKFHSSDKRVYISITEGMNNSTKHRTTCVSKKTY